MTTIVVTRPCAAETGGGQWRAGETYTASTSYAQFLIGRGDAYSIDGSLDDISITSKVVTAEAFAAFVAASALITGAIYRVGTPEVWYRATAADTYVGMDPSATATATATAADDSAYPETHVTSSWFTPSDTDWIKAEQDYIQANPTQEFRGYWPLEGFCVDQTTPTFVICYPKVGSAPTNITFTWRVRAAGSTTYTEQVSTVAGRHVMRWAQELKRGGSYEWQCKRGDTGEWSDWRPFTITTDATTWLFETDAQRLANIKALARPRSKPLDFERRILLYKAGGPLRAQATYTISRFATWTALAIPGPGTYTVNNLQTEVLTQINAWWLEQSEGGGTYKTAALSRLRTMITGGAAFTPAGLPNSYSTDSSSLRHLILLLGFAWDLWQSDLTAGDKTDLLALADAKIATQYDGIKSGVSTLDNMLGFVSYWRSTTFTNRQYLCIASALFAGSAGMSAQMIANTDDGAAKLEYNINWLQNYGTHDGVNAEFEYYGTIGFYEPVLWDMTSGLIGRDIFEARPFLKKWVRAAAIMYPPTSTTRFYPFSDCMESSGGTVKNVGHAFLEPPKETRGWMDKAYASPALMADAQAAQAAAYSSRAQVPTDKAIAPALGLISLDSGLAASNDGRASGAELWVRCSPIGSVFHMHADHSAYVVGHGGKNMLGFPGMYKWAGSVGAASRKASCKSIAHNTVGMDLVDYDGAGAGTMLQCLGQQKWANAATGTESYLHRTRGRFISAHDTAQYQALVCDATPAYWDTGYELSKAYRAIVHIRPGLLVVIDAFDSASGPHTWHHQFKTAVLPTYAAPWVTVSDSPGVVKLQTPYASGTVSRTLGNQGWWDAQTPPLTPPAAPYNNSFDLPSAESMRLVVVGQIGSEAVSSISASASGDVITVLATYAGITWTVVFDAGTGTLTVGS